MTARRPCVLTIAGSDSGGGAGIQADLKAIESFAVHGATAIAAITAQNSRGVTAVEILSDEIVEAQIDAVMSDLRPAVVKLGMLGNARIVRLVARKIDQWVPSAVVLDPVMIASSGAALLEEDAIDAVRELLVPRATIVTPNWPEAAALINARPRGLHDLDRIRAAFLRLGTKSVLLKGGHLEGAVVVDTFFDSDTMRQFEHPRIENAEGHGTGCTLASAIAANMALGLPLVEACERAVDFVHTALTERYAVGNSRPLFLASARRGM